MSRDSIAPEIRILLVSQLPQIDGARERSQEVGEAAEELERRGFERLL